MLLPGISGSTLLLILGIYIPAILAVKELLHLHLEYLPGVLALGLGMGLGVILTSGGIRKALPPLTFSTFQILGFLLGAALPAALETLKTRAAAHF